MKSKILAFLGLSTLATGLLYAVTTSTNVGRMELAHPDLSHDGGSALHTKIRNQWTLISDHSHSRYFEETAIADSTLTTLRHNFGVVFAEQNIKLYTGTGTSKVRISDPAGAGWTVAANGTNPKQEIDITTPGSGGPHTFSVQILMGGGSVEALNDLDDVDIVTTAPEDSQALIFDSGSGAWIPGASGDASFKIQSFTTTTVTIKNGYMWIDGNEYGTYDGAGTASTDFTTDLVFTPSGLGVSEKHFVYVDRLGLTKITQSDTGRVVFQVANTDFFNSTTIPDDIDQSRYAPIGFFTTNGSSQVATIGTLAFRYWDSFKNVKLVNVEDWTSFTPTGSMTSNVTYTGYYKRVGDNIIVRVKVAVTGVPSPSGTLTIDLPSGLTWDSTKILFDQAAAGPLGWGVIAGANLFHLGALYASTNSIRLSKLNEENETSNTQKYNTATDTSPETLGSGDNIYIEFSGPIAGWTTETDAVATPNNTFSSTITSKNTSGTDSKHQVTGLPSGFSGRTDYHCVCTYHDDSAGRDHDYAACVYDKSVSGEVTLDLDTLTFAASDTLGLVCGFGTKMTALPLTEIVTVSAASTLSGDSIVKTVLGSTGSAFTTTLPAAAASQGRKITFKKTSADSNAWTIDGNLSETIDGIVDFEIREQYDILTIQSDGSNWVILDFFTTELISATDTTTRTQTSPSASTWYHMGSTLNITLLPGTWDVEYSVLSRADDASGSSVNFITSLGTTSSNNDMLFNAKTVYITSSSDITNMFQTHTARGTIVVGAGATQDRYVNISTTVGTLTNLRFTNTDQTGHVTARRIK